MSEELRKRLGEWETGPVKKALKETGERAEEFTTNSGIPVKRLYTPLDLEERGIDYLKDLGFPGEFPGTRGPDTLMHRAKIWDMAQYSGYGSGEDTNKRLKYLLERGQSGFYVALHLPTQVGLDSDHPMARGEVGKVGVAIDSLQDLEDVFRDIPLDKVRSIRTTAMSIGPIWMAMVIALAEKQGASPNSFKMVIQNDVLKEYIARGTQIFPPKPALKFSTDAIEYAARNLPNWVTLQVAGAHIQNSGANVTQEIAFVLSNAIAYLESAVARGVDIDDVAPKVELLPSAQMDFFEQIAKFRAYRKLWAKILKERFGAKKPESLGLRMNAFTSGFPLTAQEPLNNIIRVAIEALAAVLGGSQALGATSYDEAICTPSEQAALLALRTQQILAYESGVTNTIDPMGGSYYLECLTDEIEKAAAQLIKKIDKMGGSVAAIESGYYQKEMTEGAFKYQNEIDSGRKVIVGVNRFRLDKKTVISPFRCDPAVGQRQIARLQELRRRRDSQAVSQALANLKKEAENDSNLVPALVEAVKAYATIGELCDTLRSVFGDYVMHPAYA